MDPILMAYAKQSLVCCLVITSLSFACLSCFDLDKVKVRDVRQDARKGTHVEWIAHLTSKGNTYARSLDVFQNGNITICGQFEEGLRMMGYDSPLEELLISSPKAAPTFVTNFSSGLELDWAQTLDGSLLNLCVTRALDDNSTVLSGLFVWLESVGSGKVSVDAYSQSAYVVLYDSFEQLDWGLKVSTDSRNKIDKARVARIPGHGQGIIVSGKFSEQATVSMFTSSDEELAVLERVNSNCSDEHSGFYVMGVDRDGTVPWWVAPRGCAVANAINALSEGYTAISGAYEHDIEFSDEHAIRKEGPSKQDGFVALLRVDEDGAAPLWVRDLSGSGNDAALTVTSTTSHDILVGGSFVDAITLSLGEDDQVKLTAGNNKEDYLFFATYSPDGELKWATFAGGPGDETISALVALSDGSFLVGGDFTESITFGRDEPRKTTLRSKGKRDGYLAYYSPAGELIFARSEGGRFGDDGITDIALIGEKPAALVLGVFEGEVTLAPRDIGERTLVAEGERDSFLMKLKIDETDLKK